jgi:hypothetical protein
VYIASSNAISAGSSGWRRRRGRWRIVDGEWASSARLF